MDERVSDYAPRTASERLAERRKNDTEPGDLAAAAQTVIDNGKASAAYYRKLGKYFNNRADVVERESINKANEISRFNTFYREMTEVTSRYVADITPNRNGTEEPES